MERTFEEKVMTIIRVHEAAASAKAAAGPGAGRPERLGRIGGLMEETVLRGDYDAAEALLEMYEMVKEEPGEAPGAPAEAEPGGACGKEAVEEAGDGKGPDKDPEPASEDPDNPETAAGPSGEDKAPGLPGDMMPIADMNLPGPSAERLADAGIRTRGDLLKATDADLRGIASNSAECSRFLALWLIATMETEGETTDFLTRKCFSPKDRRGLRKSAAAMGVSPEKYCLFATGLPLAPASCMKDSEIREIVEKAIGPDGKVYFLSNDKGYQKICRLANRSGYRMSEFMNLYGYEYGNQKAYAKQAREAAKRGREQEAGNGEES